ncbi:FAD-binding oxidoreductase [bacterium]|nr:FAD-binding oxidoreductase [bacterium]
MTESTYPVIIEETFGDLLVPDAAFPTVAPRNTRDVCDIVRWARGSSWRLFPVGNGTNFSEDFTVPEEVLVVWSGKRNKIYAPDEIDLTLEVEAGAQLQEVVIITEQSGFRLEGVPSDYMGSVGGYFAHANGLRSRSSILGVTIVDGRGNEMKFGGKVKKDVSGFDVPAFFASSRGTIGWIDSFHLRIFPVNSSQVERPAYSGFTQNSSFRGLYQSIAKAFDPDNVFMKASF